MGETLRLLKKVLNIFFDKEINKTERILPLLCDEFYCCGLAIDGLEDGVIDGRAQAAAFLGKKVNIDLCDCKLSYEDEREISSGMAVLVFVLHMGKNQIRYRVTAASRKTEALEQLCMLHLSSVEPENAMAVYSQNVTTLQQAQRKLQQGEELIQTACEFADLWVWVYNLETDRVHYFKKTQDDFGVLEYMEDFPNSWLSMGYISQDYAEIYRGKVQELKAGQNRVEFECQIRHKSGNLHWSRVRMNRLSNNRDMVIVTSQLIDSEKYLEARIELEEKHQAEDNTNLMAHFIINLSREEAINHTYRKGERREVLEWNSLEQQLERTTKYIVNPQKREEFIRLHNTGWLLHNFTKGITEYTMEYRRRVPSGKVVWVRTIMHLVQDPKNGEILNYEYAYDIHQQKIYEEILAAVVEFGFELCASLMVDSNQVTILRADKENGGNELQLEDYLAANEAYAQTIIEEDRQMYLEACSLENIFERLKSENHFEIMHRTLENGVIHYKKDQCYGYSDDRETCLLLRSDVTALIESEHEKQEKLQRALSAAEAATAAKTDFLSRVSHDMRTPLNGILGLTTLLQDYVTDKMTRQDLQQIEQSGKYLLNLINDTLDVSKIESGKLELRPVVCDGRTVFNNVLGMISPNMKERDINFHISAENLPFTMLYMDVGRVQQIVMNILGNAVKFTQRGGDIYFSMRNLSVKDGLITDEIVVRDTGAGMSESFLPHLFEPFTQEHNTVTSSSQGTGLGMTITKQILDLMGGEISVKSEIGVGTTFSIILPMKIASDEQIEEWRKQQEKGVVLHMLEGSRILLCEDHPLNAAIAVRLLQNKGVVVECAENGQIGVDKFRKSPPGYYDAVLMDIRMPVMNGIDAARLIRTSDRRDASEIPIIAMTANALSSDIEQTKAAGMNAHLSKPIDANKLFETLEGLIGRRSSYVRGKVLVVDDIDVNRFIINKAVCDDFDVLEAGSGREALEILQNTKGIDAVITDIQMPDMDGIALIQKIRENPAYRHMAIIANTQYGEPEQEEYLLEIGANDFVYKPTTPKIVSIRLKNVVRNMK